MQTATLVVLERGSLWPALQNRSHERIILTPHSGETAAGILRRTYDRMQIVERAGRVIDTTI